MWITFSVITILFVGAGIFMNQPSFGKSPRGERLERIKKSPNYSDGKFQNLSPTKQITSEKSYIGTMFDFLFHKVEELRPGVNLPTVKTDLKQIRCDEEVLVWLGHSSVFIQTGGKRYLVDPVLVKASPVSFINKPFKGTKIYTPDDIPEIDYLVITHDHWDHLDYKTVKQIMGRTENVICPLGVGEYMESWGFGKERIIELDWNENATLGDGLIVYCLPARHFSGRGLSPNKTLWASFMLQAPSRNIYISGDGGYDTHFADINKQFGTIDFAILENGQYNEDWRFIHLLPDDLVKAAKDLNAKRLMTVHNSKYALGRHSWHEPLDNIASAAEKESLNLVTPMIGEPVNLNDTTRAFKKWWKNINF